jgi:hypothetical protein
MSTVFNAGRRRDSEECFFGWGERKSPRSQKAYWRYLAMGESTRLLRNKDCCHWLRGGGATQPIETLTQITLVQVTLILKADQVKPPLAIGVSPMPTVNYL